ncbi:MAG: discoidin domain-containing protein [Candidatus Handelsmanbacteria bacterium]|nr:discoidin domain-containing protein [Candidatus Handelsmanbacteria bacterium]
MRSPALALLPLFLAVSLLLPGSSAGTAWQDTTWSSTTYYLTQFSAAEAGPGTIEITAVDSYELSFNGTALGSDDNWTDAETYSVSVKKGKNEILVKVQNSGRGQGNGLVVSLVQGEVRFVSAPGNGPFAWRWLEADPQNADWNAAPLVQLGDLEVAKVASLTNPDALPIVGFPGDVNVGSPGGISISRVEGKNLVLNGTASRIEVTDGLLETSWQPGVNSLNKFVSLDLGQARRINRVRVLSEPPRSAGSFAENSLKGYAVQISEDLFRWSEVGVLHGITQFDATAVDFSPIATRFLRLVVAEIDGITSPRVGEIEVYGEGYNQEGSFLSPPLDLGSAGRPKNFGRASWETETPDWTQVRLQFRTSSDGQLWSQWSEETTQSGVLVSSPEPAALLQYRIKLSTDDERQSPQLRRLAIEYSAEDLPASAASATVSPQQVPMGVDTAFVCELAMTPTAGRGAERLLIAMPDLTTLESVEGYAGKVTQRLTPEGLELSFDPLLSQDVKIHFRTALFGPLHTFNCALFGPGSDNPLNVGPAEEGALSAYVTEVVGKVLLDTQAKPRIFTPNGDGINDFSVIEYTLAKVSEAVDVSLEIVALDGEVVRRLYRGSQLPRRYHQVRGAESLTSALPGYWDGIDDHGNLVRPGVYLYHLEATVDEGKLQRIGVVSVVY